MIVAAAMAAATPVGMAAMVVTEQAAAARAADWLPIRVIIRVIPSGTMVDKSPSTVDHRLGRSLTRTTPTGDRETSWLATRVASARDCCLITNRKSYV